jgi:hypothetical protein
MQVGSKRGLCGVLRIKGWQLLCYNENLGQKAVFNKAPKALR